MTKKVIRFTPDELGYKDRGIMKWRGLILSAQTEALKQIDKEEKKGKPVGKNIMSEIEISRYLQQSFLSKSPVSIQANTLKNGHFYPDVHCIVIGFNGDKIFLKLKDKREISCEINQIRNIEFMNIKDWFEK